MSSSHSSPAEAQSLLSLVAGLRLDLLLLDYGGIVPALCHSQPILRQPQQGGTHWRALSAVCGVKTCSCTTPIFLAPTRHNEDPDRHYKHRPPLERPTERAAGKWPRTGTPGGARLRGYVPTGFDPPRAFPTGICEIGSCPLTEFRKLSRLPDSGRPAQRT